MYLIMWASPRNRGFVREWGWTTPALVGEDGGLTPLDREEAKCRSTLK